MKKVKLESKKIIGIAVRTTNENAQAATDIGMLWEQLMAQNIVEQIPNKVSNAIYSVYTDYESDYTKPYTVILGCEVTDLTEMPEGMVSLTIAEANAAMFTVEGKLSDNIVYKGWENIWSMDLDRIYVADYEVYDERTTNPDQAEVDIFIGIK
ncbi:GyrI-like domain-containing protein [Crocinitomix catalasitica]|uniref:GyrI-like domain-containing protein n=1 Tax=Crocinitomix catalasitica TaxID=184607 RepID=UPI000488BB8D|nr:GyrI-like domain-containing protein [Crocinitomix catalasitica]